MIYIISSPVAFSFQVSSFFVVVFSIQESILFSHLIRNLIVDIDEEEEPRDPHDDDNDNGGCDEEPVEGGDEAPVEGDHEEPKSPKVSIREPSFIVDFTGCLWVLLIFYLFLEKIGFYKYGSWLNVFVPASLVINYILHSITRGKYGLH